MDINKLNNNSKSSINKSKSTAKSASSKRNKSADTSRSSGDKVSIKNFTFKNNDELFAKLELEKLNNASSERYKQIKSQVSDYKKASEKSSQAASDTEMGEKVNDSEVWEEIANRIIR